MRTTRAEWDPKQALVATLATLLCALGAPALAQSVRADFNADGYDDLVIGVPYENVGAVADAGAVNVLYGAFGGLTASGNQFWHQDSFKVLDSCEALDHFGRALAAGDFNGDGFADLAVGVPYEGIGAAGGAGAVAVFLGSASGLVERGNLQGNQLWHQDSASVLDVAEATDYFGSALATGDFNGDGFADLAIGVPGESVGTIGFAGAVSVLLGSASGLTAAGNQFWHQDSIAIVDAAESNDNFGSALATGDFNGDGFADLAIGVPQESIGTIPAAGAVSVLLGSASGLTSIGNQLLNQGNPQIFDTPEEYDHFGSALAAGDFNQDGFADLAIGVPLENLALGIHAGAVSVYFGSPAGLGGLPVSPTQFWHQDSYPSILDSIESYDNFGETLAVGDFNDDGFADLAIGVPGEDIGTINAAGAASVLYGASNGLVPAGNQFWNQDSPSVLDTSEAPDSFGSALAAGDFNGDGFADLAIGVPGESVGAISGAGAASVLYGALGGGLVSAGNQLWHQDVAGVLDAAEANDGFGFAAASTSGSN